MNRTDIFRIFISFWIGLSVLVVAIPLIDVCSSEDKIYQFIFFSASPIISIIIHHIQLNIDRNAAISEALFKHIEAKARFHIENQHIYGGKQQFADIIKNQGAET